MILQHFGGSWPTLPDLSPRNTRPLGPTTSGQQNPSRRAPFWPPTFKVANFHTLAAKVQSVHIKFAPVCKQHFSFCTYICCRCTNATMAALHLYQFGASSRKTFEIEIGLLIGTRLQSATALSKYIDHASHLSNFVCRLH